MAECQVCPFPLSARACTLHAPAALMRVHAVDRPRPPPVPARPPPPGSPAGFLTPHFPPPGASFRLGQGPSKPGQGGPKTACAAGLRLTLPGTPCTPARMRWGPRASQRSWRHFPGKTASPRSTSRCGEEVVSGQGQRGASRPRRGLLPGLVPGPEIAVTPNPHPALAHLFTPECRRTPITGVPGFQAVRRAVERGLVSAAGGAGGDVDAAQPKGLRPGGRGGKGSLDRRACLLARLGSVAQHGCCAACSALILPVHGEWGMGFARGGGMGHGVCQRRGGGPWGLPEGGGWGLGFARDGNPAMHLGAERSSRLSM